MDLDTRTLPDGRIVVVPRDRCAYGHPVATRGTAPCPRCGSFQRFYSCGDIYCGGRVTSRAHEAVCPPEPAASAGSDQPAGLVRLPSPAANRSPP